jgi:hypothetical protein
MKAMYSRRFCEFDPAFVTLPVVAFDVIVVATVDGLALGLPWRISAATPATCGEAIDVPLIVFVAVLLVDHADVIELPGANTSRQLPKFEYDARASLLVVAPTVSAALTRAGE